ncbi:MAG: TniQ family protein [Lachnospiraceae bacterium]|nr:TniQ family protein [Lachnospiraceae bacterium]
MIGYMPMIYPDELVYSWFCRYFVHSGYTANRMALSDILYNRHCNPSKEFIGHLNPEMEQLITEIDSMDRLVLEHTMFSQYARFIECSKKKDALYRLGHDFCDAHHLFSVLPRSNGDQHMKYCPLCAAEDREQYGETYWHRQHQIRNMSVCIKHKCRLENSDISAKSDHIFVFEPAEDAIQDKDAQQIENPLELEFASYMADIFKAPIDFNNEIPISAILYSGMENTKYMKSTGRIRNSRMLADDLLEYYSKISLNEVASYSQIQRTLLGNRSDFFVVSQIAFFLRISVNDLVKPSLSEEQVIKEQNARNPKKEEWPNDWNQYDTEMVPIVEQAAYDIYHGNFNGIGRPERISERLIYKYAGVSGHRIENMPKCRETLKKYAESYGEHWARRVVWAYQKIRSEEPDKTVFWTDIRRLAGVKKKHLPDILPELNKFADKCTADEIIKMLEGTP